MSQEAPHFKDPREIPKPFLREIAFRKITGRARMVGPAIVFDNRFAVKPAKTEARNPGIVIVAIPGLRVVRDQVLDHEPAQSPHAGTDKLNVVFVRFREYQKTVYIGEKYAVSYRRDVSTPEIKVFRISSSERISDVKQKDSETPFEDLFNSD